MKKKAIKVEYRKDSDSFPEWLKYEITILKEDGTTEKVPAYGKDLQDALSRVVHDQRVDKIKRVTQFIPTWFWMLIFMAFLSIITILSINNDQPLIMLIGFIITIILYFVIDYRTTKINKINE